MKNTLLLIALLSSTFIHAQIVTDRPDQTESSSTVGAKNLQIETGVLLGFEGENEPSTQQILAPTTLFRYGLNDKFELRFVSQFESIKVGADRFQGIADSEIGFKVELGSNEKTEIAFLSHLVLPLGTEELTGNRFGTVNKLSISHGFNENVGLGYNIGYDYFGEGDGSLTYSLALGVTVNEKVGIYVEPYGELVDFDKHISNFDAGFTYLINENVQLDFSFGVGLNQKMNYLSFGISSLILSTEK